LPRWRLVVSDLDGTMLDDAGQIPAENLTAVTELDRHGILFTLATGRLDRMTGPYVRQLQVRLPMVACNGAVLRDCVTGQLLEQTALPEADVWSITAYLAQNRLDYLCYSADGVYYPAGSRRIRYFEQFNMRLAESGDPLIELACLDDVPLGRIAAGLVKILAVLPDPDQVVRLHDLLQTRTQSAGVLSAQTAMDIMAAGVSKASGLARLSKRLHIPMTAVLAIGDHDNDAEMLRSAGLGIAMQNASEQAKAAASTLTGVNNEAGVAQAIRRHVLAGL
jgi:hypothetical protein